MKLVLTQKTSHVKYSGPLILIVSPFLFTRCFLYLQYYCSIVDISIYDGYPTASSLHLTTYGFLQWSLFAEKKKQKKLPSLMRGSILINAYGIRSQKAKRNHLVQKNVSSSLSMICDLSSHRYLARFRCMKCSLLTGTSVQLHSFWFAPCYK